MIMVANRSGLCLDPGLHHKGTVTLTHTADKCMLVCS